MPNDLLSAEELRLAGEALSRRYPIIAPIYILKVQGEYYLTPDRGKYNSQNPGGDFDTTNKEALGEFFGHTNITKSPDQMRIYAEIGKRHQGLPLPTDSTFTQDSQKNPIDIHTAEAANKFKETIKPLQRFADEKAAGALKAGKTIDQLKPEDLALSQKDLDDAAKLFQAQRGNDSRKLKLEGSNNQYYLSIAWGEAGQGTYLNKKPISENDIKTMLGKQMVAQPQNTSSAPIANSTSTANPPKPSVLERAGKAFDALGSLFTKSLNKDTTPAPQASSSSSSSSTNSNTATATQQPSTWKTVTGKMVSDVSNVKLNLSGDEPQQRAQQTSSSSSATSTQSTPSSSSSMNPSSSSSTDDEAKSSLGSNGPRR